MSFRIFARTLLELGCAVAAFTPDPDNLRLWIAANCPRLDNNLRILELRDAIPTPGQGRFRVFFDKLRWVRFVADSIRSANIKPDLVFHAWLDNCLTPGITAGLTNLAFPYKWSGLWFHPWYLRKKQKLSLLRRGPFTNHNALLSRNCTGVGILDEGVADEMQSLLGKKPVVIFPDVADASAPDPHYGPALEIREKACGRKIIAIIGGLERRKGVMNLMDIARRSAKENWFFVFAGRLVRSTFSSVELNDFSSFAGSNPSNCYFLLHHIPDEPQFNALIDTADVLFAVYPNFLSSSNQLTKAALFRKPVLVSDSFCMGERVQQYGIGLAIPENDVAACIRALHQLCDPDETAGILKSARFDDYSKAHSLDRLREAFGHLLKAAE